MSLTALALASQFDYSALEFLLIRAQTAAAVSRVLVQLGDFRAAREKANVKNLLMPGTGTTLLDIYE
jgi:hypothetical protein